MEKPPLETDPPFSHETARLIVTALIAVGAARGPQFVSCTIHPEGDSGSAQPFEAVAKIYDPLNYGFQSEYGGGPRDTVYLADQDYSKEAATYEELLKGGQTGACAPSYYGSWTFCIPSTSVGKPYARSARLILMKHLNGKTMRDTRIQNNPDRRRPPDPSHYPGQYRLELLARAMDGFVRQLQVGVDQYDFAGRNVVLAPDPNSNATLGGLPLPRVVLIDYNNATVDAASHEQRIPLLPERPIQIFWNDCHWGILMVGPLMSGRISSFRSSGLFRDSTARAEDNSINPFQS